MTSTGPAPGWYPDPTDPASLRWWDGHTWTQHTTKAPQAEPEPAPAAVVEPEPAPVALEPDPAPVVEAEPAPEPVAVEPAPAPVVEPQPAPVAVERAPTPALDVAPAPAAEPPAPAAAPPGPVLPAPATAAGGARAARVSAGTNDAFRAALQSARAARTGLAVPAPPMPAPTMPAVVATVVEPAPAPAPAAPEPVLAAPQPEPVAAEPEPAPVVPEPEPVVPAPAPVVAAPVAVVPEPEPATAEPEAEPQPVVAEPAPQPTVEAPAIDEPAAAAPPRKRVRKGRLAALSVLALAAGAGGTVAYLETTADSGPVAMKPAVAPADAECLKAWNTGDSVDAAQLRVTLGQFTGAYGRVSRVQPLPGTLMQADSCALTVYDPSTDAHAIFVAGVEDQPGYLDVTTYPRAAKYGWPKSPDRANVRIESDGTIRSIG